MTSRMAELQDAMNRYGAASIRNFTVVRALGEKIVAGFGGYLGKPNCVVGVPPSGPWDAESDHADASFSFYGADLLTVEPIRMRLAIRIPHTKDGGSFDMRIVLEFAIEGQTWSLGIGDRTPVRGLPVDPTDEQLAPAYEAIFEYARDFFLDPVSYFEAERAGLMGFLAKIPSRS
jgi:hypothetical protein